MATRKPRLPNNVKTGQAQRKPSIPSRVQGRARLRSKPARQQSGRLLLLETALSASASAVVITDHEGVIEWVNPAFTTLTGYACSEVIGRSPRLLRSGQHPQAFYQQLWATILEGSVWRGELINRRKDGSLYQEEQTITPVRGADGAITHFIAMKQDVSARVASEREQSVLAALAAALRSAPTRAHLVQILAQQVGTLTHAGGAALALLDPWSGEAVFEAGAGALAYLADLRLPMGAGLTGRVICDGSPVVSSMMPDATDAPDHSPGHAAPAQVGLPLRVGNETIGALWLSIATPPIPSKLHLLEAVAEMAASALHRADLHEQTSRRLQRLTSLHTVDQTITASLDIDLTLTTVLNEVIAQLGVDAAAVLRADAEQQALHYQAGRGFRTDEVIDTHIRPGEGLLGELVLAHHSSIHLPLIPVTGDRFARGALLDHEGFVSYYALPLLAKGQLKGVLEIFNRTPRRLDTEALHFLELLASRVAVAIDSAELFEHLQRANRELTLAYDSTLEGWARALELHDHETEGHSRRVTQLTERLARALDVAEENLIHLRRGALLHDIGKMGVPDSVLHKSGPLSAEEWALIREHPVHAHRLLSPIAYLQPALDIPYAHHERWDGSGYPRGLRGEAIPLAARIFAVVDVWDALTTKRPYKPAWDEERARTYLHEQAGKQFDPAVVTVFLQLLASGYEPAKWDGV